MIQEGLPPQDRFTAGEKELIIFYSSQDSNPSHIQWATPLSLKIRS